MIATAVPKPTTFITLAVSSQGSAVSPALALGALEVVGAVAMMSMVVVEDISIRFA